METGTGLWVKREGEYNGTLSNGRAGTGLRSLLREQGIAGRLKVL